MYYKIIVKFEAIEEPYIHTVLKKYQLDTFIKALKRLDNIESYKVVKIQEVQ